MGLTDELDRLRGLIDEVDRGIVEMLELRVKLARAVGLIKMMLGRPLRDGERERVVLEKVREMASERGLNPPPRGGGLQGHNGDVSGSSEG